jgi:hypothetical protein
MRLTDGRAFIIVFVAIAVLAVWARFEYGGPLTAENVCRRELASLHTRAEHDPELREMYTAMFESCVDGQ